MAVKPCSHCGSVLTRPPSHFTGALTFCDQECRKAYHRPEQQCRGCEDTFRRNPNAATLQYCSWDCFKASRWVVATCHVCLGIFEDRLSEHRRRLRNGGVTCCSIACRNRHAASVNAGGVTVADTALLYLMRSGEQSAVKVGIALSERRIREHERHGWVVIETRTGTGQAVLAIEQAVLDAWRGAGLTLGHVPAPSMPQKGHTETTEDTPEAVRIALELITSTHSKELSCAPTP